MTDLTLHGARLLDATGERSGQLRLAGGTIAAVGPGKASRQAVDASGFIITPGFVDVHTHGGGGFSFQTTAPEEIRAYARWAPTTGTTAFLPTLVGVAEGLPEAELRTSATAIEDGGPGAEALGIHLEGPYMNPRRRGAHDVSWLRLPDPAISERLLAAAAGHLRLITLAPELPGAHAAIHRFVAAGTVVSLGHSDATYEQALAAIPLGITHATHCFNAMPPLLHRAPGALGAIVECEQILGELIGDGIHVQPAAMRVLIRALGPERTVVITDALAAAGAAAGTFSLGDQAARVVDGVARLADGTIAGSVLTMDQALRNLVRLVGVPLPSAVAMLTRNPARSVGVGDRKGLLAPGYDADLVMLDDALTVQATLCRGRLAYATPDWAARLAALG